MNDDGEMQEWFNWPLSKSGVAETLPRVRIPLSPPDFMRPFWAHFLSAGDLAVIPPMLYTST